MTKVSIPETHYSTFIVPDSVPLADVKRYAQQMMLHGEKPESTQYSHTDDNPDNYLIDMEEPEKTRIFGESEKK
jgi:hypothetical protein